MSKREKNLAIIGFIIIMVISAIAVKIYGMQKEEWSLVDNDPMVTVATGIKETCGDCGAEISNNWIWHKVPKSQERILPATVFKGGLCDKCARKALGPQLTSWDPANPKKN